MLGVHTRALFGAGLLAATALASPASAATFLFTFDGDGGADGSGTLITEDAPTAGGGLLITGITGTFRGGAITSLLAPGTFGGNDNLLFPDAGSGAVPDRLLSFAGFSFTFQGGAPQPANIFATTLVASGYGVLEAGESIAAGSFSVTRVTTPPPVGAIPEPGTWALMLLGFGFVGAAMRRRPAIRVSVSYA